jgi:hypothetical protein
MYDINIYKNLFYEKYYKNIYSHNGEDGIIEEILNRLNINEGWICKYTKLCPLLNKSSTINLVKKGFKEVFIIYEKVKYVNLLRICEDYPNIIPIRCEIDYENENNNKSFDNILSKTNIPNDFDVLYINIIYYNYQVWKSLKKYNPKIVIIEINSSIDPNNNEYINSCNEYINIFNKCVGTGFRPMYNLGIEKGYTFLLHTGNMIFVRNDLFNKLNITYENELENFIPKWYIEENQDKIL